MKNRPVDAMIVSTVNFFPDIESNQEENNYSEEVEQSSTKSKYQELGILTHEERRNLRKFFRQFE